MIRVTPESPSEPASIDRQSRASLRESVSVETLESRILLTWEPTVPSATDLLQLTDVSRPDDVSTASGTATQATSIVADEPITHSNPISAQPVPYADNLLVEGAVAPTQALDMYRVPIGNDTQSLTVNLSSPESAAAVRLWVFDASGRELGNFPLSPSADLSVVLKPIDPSAGEVVFIAVSHEDSGSAVDPGLYLLRITRSDDSDSTGSQALGFGAFSPSLPSAGVPSGAFGSTIASNAAASAADAVAVALPGLGQAVASIPLPIRSASPSGGLLGDGESEAAPPLDLAADAVDRALSDLGASFESTSADLIPARLRISLFLDEASAPREAATTIVQTSFYHPTSARSLASPPILAPTPIADRREIEETEAESAELAEVGLPLGAGFGIAAFMGVGLILPDVVGMFETIRRHPPRLKWRVTGGEC